MTPPRTAPEEASSDPGIAIEPELEGETVERAVARIDLGAVSRNCAHLRSLLRGSAELCAVVKADGYGHGATPCARAALNGGATWLAVATAREAQALRTGGIDCRLLVMGALTPSNARTAVRASAEVVAWREDLVEQLAELARAAPVRVHVKLDTGMGRLGTADRDEAARVAARVAAHPRLELAGVMTHFATADELDDDHFPAQLQAFTSFVEEMRALYPDLVAHAANSAATYRDAAAHFDLVRCGVAVYGLDPFQRDPTERGLEPALALESYVAEVKPLAPGESAGYGRRFVASEATCIGVLPIGYGDGVRRGLTSNAEVLVGGRRRPLVGTVSMDNITIDLGPDTHVRVLDPAVLIGAQGDKRLTAEDMARRLDTINYEVTCGLSPRVERAYIGE
jgi:alanine racemase